MNLSELTALLKAAAANPPSVPVIRASNLRGVSPARLAQMQAQAVTDATAQIAAEARKKITG